MSGREWDVLLPDGNHIRLTADRWDDDREGGWLAFFNDNEDGEPVAAFISGTVAAVIRADVVPAKRP